MTEPSSTRDERREPCPMLDTPLGACKRIVLAVLAEHGGKLYDETLSSKVQAAYEKVGMTCGDELEKAALKELRRKKRIRKSCWDWVLIKPKAPTVVPECPGQGVLFGEPPPARTSPAPNPS